MLLGKAHVSMKDTRMSDWFKERSEWLKEKTKLEVELGRVKRGNMLKTSMFSKTFRDGSQSPNKLRSSKTPSGTTPP